MLSPRSATYERLESGRRKRSGSGDRPPGAGGGGVVGFTRRVGWKKLAVGVSMMVGLVWLVGPRAGEGIEIGKGWIYNNMPQTKSEQPATVTSPPAPAPDAAGGGEITISPTPDDMDAALPKLSFETDPDPAKTLLCDKPRTPTTPLVQWALMVDAGSTGSRIHAYKFSNCGAAPHYEYEVFKMTQPGLSSFAHDALGAAKSLDVLLDEAMRVVPPALRKCTPVAVKATAGLRLLPGSQSKDILDAVEKRIKKEYPFQLQEEGGVVIMDGKDEGVYAWITANYLLGMISPGASASTDDMEASINSVSAIAADTYAVLDLGGASTQIVFEPVFEDDGDDDPTNDVHLLEGEHKYDLAFGSRQHVLYQHSYLGYGLMKARSHVHKLVDFMASIRTTMTENKNPAIGNPCLAKGTKKAVDMEDDEGRKRVVEMDGDEVGGFEACDKVVQLVMAKDAICQVKPCSFNGVYQPSLLDTFPSGKVLLLSYFYDRLNPLVSALLNSPTNLPPSHNIPTSSPIHPTALAKNLTVSTIAALAREVCLGPQRWAQLFAHDEDLMEELEGRPEWCLDLTFMHGLLRVGYEFGEGREVVIGKKLRETELGWCLGATIAMVGAELKCRA